MKSRISIDLAGEEGKQLHDLLTYYRLLRRETWPQMILKSLSTLASTENQAIADAIDIYMKRNAHGVYGRPYGSKQPASFKKGQSERMKIYWEKKRNKVSQLKEAINNEKDN